MNFCFIISVQTSSSFFLIMMPIRKYRHMIGYILVHVLFGTL